MNKHHRLLSALILCVLFFPSPVHGKESKVVLCVPGISIDIKRPKTVWGEKVRGADDSWSGMVGFFQKNGYVFGGTITAHTGLPQPRRPGRAKKVFLLVFSREAVVDGLGMKGMELAQALGRVRRLTGAGQITLVSHSAGGLVARAYMQGGIAGVPYRGDVDRLITISTPHFGSVLATSVGDYLGTRATSLQAGAALIRRLNDQLPLPADVLYASIVVRGQLSDFNRQGEQFLPYVVKKRYDALPLSLKRGSDQVIQSVNQNLALAATAAAYERRTGRPIVYPLVVVAPPSRPTDRPEMNKIHNHAMGTEALQNIVLSLIERDIFWRPVSLREKSDWITRESRFFAMDAMTEKSLAGHLFQEIVAVHLTALAPRLQAADLVAADFSGVVSSRLLGFSAEELTTTMAGRLSCRYDRFGRAQMVSAHMEEAGRGN